MLDRIGLTAHIGECVGKVVVSHRVAGVCAERAAKTLASFLRQLRFRQPHAVVVPGIDERRRRFR